MSRRILACSLVATAAPVHRRFAHCSLLKKKASERVRGCPSPRLPGVWEGVGFMARMEKLS